MTEQAETSSEEGGERPITVSRLVPTKGITFHHIARAVRSALNDQPIRTIDVAIVDDSTIASLHEQYLNKAGATDVLAFDLRDRMDDEMIEGQIVVSAETARRQAKSLGVDEKEELLRYVIHGTLHLCGYEDKNPAGRRRMRRVENRVLAKLEQVCRSAESAPKPRRTTSNA